MQLLKRTLPKEETALFARQLSLVAQSDVPMQQGLEIISDRSRNKKIQTICHTVADQLGKGISFTDAVSGYSDELGTLFIEMSSVGEKSGNLPIMLERVADSIEKDLETKSKIRSAVSYPLILGTLMLAVIVLLLVYVLPMFNEILTSLGGNMNSFTRGLMDFGIFISNNFVLIILVIVAVVLAAYIAGRTGRGRYFRDYMKLHLPWTRGINRADTASVFARNLAMLIRSGINVTIAVDMLRGIIDNRVIAVRLWKTEQSLSEGERIEKAFGELDLFPDILIKLFSVAMETGGLDKTLEKAADIMEKETDEKLERMTSVIEPLMVILLSVLVGFILISVILPVTGILNSIG